MALDPNKFTDEQWFELLNSSIIAAGSLAAAYRAIAETPLIAKDFEAAYDRALYAVTSGVDKHLKRISS